MRDDEMSPQPRSDVRVGRPEEKVRVVGDRVLSALGRQSWLDRPGYRLEHALGGRHVRGVAASAVGYGITAASGYLGAHLVYRQGVGVDQSGGRWDTGEWTPLLAEAALEAGTPQRVEVDGVGLVLLTDGDDVLAFGERCPHLGAPMVDGWLDRGQLVCPWHGSRFDPATGQVVHGPATAPLPCYQTRIRAGSIEVRPGRPTGLRAATGAGV